MGSSVGHAAHVLLQGPDPGYEPDAVLSLDGVLLLLPQLHGQEHPRPARLQPAHEPRAYLLHLPLRRREPRYSRQGRQTQRQQRGAQQQARSDRRDDHGADHGRLPEPHLPPAPAAAGVPGLRDRPAHLHPVHRRRRVLRSPGRYLPGSDVRVRRARHRRSAASGQLLYLQLHAVRRFRHGVQLLWPPLPRHSGAPPVLPRPLRGRADPRCRCRRRQGVHPLHREADRREVELGCLLHRN